VTSRNGVGCGKVIGLGREGQYPERDAPPLPLAGEGWGGGASAGASVKDSARASQTANSGTRGDTPTRLASLGTLPRTREREDHTDAVVTPPSTTIVWPVMNVEASEAR
jgi:hypothetical protein